MKIKIRFMYNIKQNLKDKIAQKKRIFALNPRKTVLIQY